MKLLLSTVAFVFYLTAPALASATTYEYIGATFNAQTATSNDTFPDTINFDGTQYRGNLHISLTFQDALPSNLAFSDVSPETWGFFDGATFINSNSAFYHLNQMKIATDAFGDISAWDIVVEGGSPSCGMRAMFLVGATSAWDFSAYPVSGCTTFDAGEQLIAHYTAGPDQCFDLPYGLPCTWPPPVWITNGASVPIPPAVWLFGSALGLMGWMRRATARIDVTS